MRFKAEIIRVLVVVVLVTAIWCRVYHRYTVRDWQVPTEYIGDGLFVLAWTKAAQDGEFLPIAPKMNRYLGAPFVANWNDFPLSEDLIFWVTGMFARVIGLGAAINLSFLAACVLAAVCFYLVGRYLRWRWEWCLMGGAIFALSSYSYFRNISHIFYTHYWHLPLCLLVCWWAGSKKGLTFRDRRYPFAVAIAVITGFLSVYYNNFFLQLLGLAVLSQVVRRSPWPKVLAPASIMAIALGAFLLASLDTLIYSFQHGINPNAFVRNYAQVEHYSLFPLELLLARVHRWPLLQDLANYYASSVAGGHALTEMVYLGLVGGVSLILLLGATVLGLLNRPMRANVLGLQAVWMIGYGMVGGLNCLLGLSGFPLFHAMNRVSIIVLALALFFLVRTLSRISRRWPRWLCLAFSLGTIVFAVADQIPRRVTKKDIEKTRTQMEADRNFVQQMEEKLPRGAMVFQLPIVQFPEGAPRNRMWVYESLRPYLFSRELRFSHGTCKGREEDSWQLDLETIPAPELVQTLERYGFGAICLNQRAYTDNGAQLLEAFRRAGRGRVIQNTTSAHACIFLEPAAGPVLPELLSDFRKGWYGMDTNKDGASFAWSKGNAAITIDNLCGETLVRYLSFDVMTLRARKLEVKVGGQSLWRTELRPGSMENARNLRLDLPPGKTIVDLATDTPAAYAGGKDPRKVAFGMARFHLAKEPPSPALSPGTP